MSLFLFSILGGEALLTHINPAGDVAKILTPGHSTVGRGGGASRYVKCGAWQAGPRERSRVCVPVGQVSLGPMTSVIEAIRSVGLEI